MIKVFYLCRTKYEKMKKLLFAFSLLISTITFSQVNWMTMNQALEAQKKKPRNILIKFYADWCEPCKLMEKNTFAQPDIARYINENYYAVKFNAEGSEKVSFQNKDFNNPKFDPNKKSTQRGVQHQFARYLNVTSYPTTVFMDEDGKMITGLVGYFEAVDVEPYLALIATKEYKKVKTQEEWINYRSKFKSKIKNK